MKHRYFTLLLTVLMSMAGTTASAYTFVVDGIYYSIISGDKVSVDFGEDSYDYDEVIIPAKVEYDDDIYTVVAIGAYAFNGCTSLTSVTLPYTLTTIYNYAFYGCTGLTSVTLPARLEEIGFAAFGDCSMLKTVKARMQYPPTDLYDAFYAPESSTLYVQAGRKAAYEADPYWSTFKEIIEVERPADAIPFTYVSTQAICVGTWDTNDDGYLTETEAAAVTDLGDVFQSASITSFKELRYFTGLTAIGDGAFAGCKYLKSIAIPSNVTSFGTNAFYGCPDLTNVYITDLNAYCNISLPDMSYGPFFDSGKGHVFLNEVEVTDLVIPNGITTVNTLFLRCVGLTSVTIPNSVTTIGDGAFFGCSGLTSVTIHNGVTTIGMSAFSGCSGLTSVAIPNSVTTIGEYAFEGCSSLTSMTIPNGVTTLEEGTFYGCSALTSVTIPNGVTTIGKKVFTDCSALTTVNIPNSVTAIEKYAFYNCSSLPFITIGNGVKTIGELAFNKCDALASVTIGSSVTTIDSNAFPEAGTSKLTDVFSLATTAPSATDAFFGTLSKINLHIPAGAIYYNLAPWKWMNQDNMQICATPTASKVDGKMKFSCETPDVTYHYSFAGEGENADHFDLSGAVNVTFYAKKEGYADSYPQTVVADIPIKGDVNEDGKVSITDAVSVVNIILGGGGEDAPALAEPEGGEEPD